MSNQDHPLRNYNFRIDIPNTGTSAHFVACSGFSVDIEAISYRPGGGNQVVYRLPGRVEYSDIIFYQGVTQARGLWDWFFKIASGIVTRENISVVLLSTQGSSDEVKWDLTAAWPRAWKGVKLSTLGNEAAIEQITFAFDELKRA